MMTPFVPSDLLRQGRIVRRQRVGNHIHDNGGTTSGSTPTLGILRYALLLEKGRGDRPEEVVLADTQLIVLGVSWVLLVATGVYLQ